MAIVKMKKLRVVGMAEQKDALLQDLLKLGCVEISTPGQLEDRWKNLLRRGTSKASETRTALADVRTALNALKEYGGAKTGLFIQRREVSEGEFFSEESVQTAKNVCDRILEDLGAISRLQGEVSRLESRKAGLQPWASLDFPLDQTETAHVVFRLCVCPGGTDLGAVRAELDAADYAADLQVASQDKQQAYVLLTYHKSDETGVWNLLRPHSFSAVSFQGTSGTAQENVAAMERQLTENREAQEAAVQRIARSADQQPLLQMYADQLAAMDSKESSSERLLTDGTVFFLEGWAPAEQMPQVQTLLEDLGCAWEAEDPAEEDIPNVPVKLKNNWFTRPLSMVTEMYSLPAYNNVDPNPLMAPFFILFYGIMMADMGYGLVMFLAGLIVTKKYKPKGTMGHLFGLLELCGVSTFIMGALTGGFFGDFLTQVVKLTTGGDFALPALFTPLNDTLMILIGAMCLGLVQIVTGMAISFVRKIKNGQYMDALWEEVTWWVTLAGIGLMAAGVTPILLYVGLVMIIVGSGWNAKGFGKVTAIFGSLYNHVTGYFGDILSYSRLMALMLAGSVIAQVFNTLGAIPGNIIIFLIISLAGNTLNFALNLLGCYVHDLRLQCLEYFGKFYEDGGKPFTPLAANTKYVDIQQ